MDAICLSDKAPEVIGIFIKELLRPEIKSLLFNEKCTDREIVGSLYLPTTIVYGIYQESMATPVGIIFFLNVSPGENCFLYMAFFSKGDRSRGPSADIYNFIKKDLLSKCPTINSIETSVVEGKSDIEEVIEKIGFEKIGTRKKYRRVGKKYLDISSYYYLYEETIK